MEGNDMKVILSTRNPGKALQIQTLFAGSGIEVLTLEEAGVIGQGNETGDTIEENATIKSRFAHDQAAGLWVMSDDTGLFIKALGGEPGAHAANWYYEGAPAEETLAYCLTRMKGIERRDATFRTHVSLISPEGEEFVFDGEAEGVILTEPRCAPQPGLPYSPIFLPKGETKVWAEMETEYENRISHRGLAFAKALAFLMKRSG